MYDALNNLLRQNIYDPLNPLFYERVKKELRALLEEHKRILIENESLIEQCAQLRSVEVLEMPRRGRPRKEES